MITSLSKLRFLQIQSTDPDIQRKGHLLQILLFLFFCMSSARIIFSLLGLENPSTSGNLNASIIQLFSTLGFLIVCFYLIRIGRIIVAVHFFAIVIIGVFFMLLVTDYAGETGLPYLMLIPIIAVATLDSIRSSNIYVVASIGAITIYTAVTPTYTLLDLFLFTLVTIGISITVWVTANNLQNAALQAQRLNEESQQKSNLLQKRTQQLQRSAQFGQNSGVSLNLEKLLLDTAKLINQEFEIYTVSIFLLNETKQEFVLRQLVGGPQELVGTYSLPNNENSIIGWVANHYETRVVTDVNNEPLYHHEALLAEARSEMALPLIARNDILGVLDIQSQELDAFKDEDIAILQIVANQLAVNIDNARLFAKTDSALHEIRTLHEFNTHLTATIDLGEIYRRAARYLTKELDAIRCLILSLPHENELRAEIGYERGVGFGKQTGFFWETAVFPLAHYPDSRQSLESQKSAIYHISDESNNREILETYGATICMELPMVSGYDTVGIIWVFRGEGQATFHQTEIELAQAMAQQTAVMAANASMTSDAQVRVAQLNTINRMSLLLSHAPSLKDIFDGARREIMALIPATGMSISLLTKEGDKLHWLYGFEFGHEVDLSGIPPLPISQGLSGYVARTREVLYLDKKDHELREQLQSFVVGADQQTWLGLPMVVSGEMIGVLAVENEDSFSEREIELLNTIVGPLASTIHNFSQFEEIQNALDAQSKQRIQLQTAAEVAAAATSVSELDALVQESVNLIKERFSLYYVGIFLIDDSTQQAVLVAGTGAAGKAQVEANHALSVGGQSLIGGATKDAKPRIIQDVTKNKEWLPNPHLPDTQAELALPLRVRGRIIGALTAQSETTHLFTDELIQVLQTLCDQLATAVENARLLARVEARAQRQQALAQISTQLHQTSDIDTILTTGLRAISTQLNGANVKLNIGNKPTLQKNASADDVEEVKSNGSS